jgi:outer membrane receptor protein involved in Fe transport
VKVDPSAIFNFSAGYSFIAGASVLRPELYIENLFDKKYLLKGAFFQRRLGGTPAGHSPPRQSGHVAEPLTKQSTPRATLNAPSWSG